MTYDEELVFFPCQGVQLAGILTVPNSPNGLVVLLPWGAGAYPSSARNRIRTRLARVLAERGFHSFRFDYLGVGESEGEYRIATMEKPYTAEVVAAGSWLLTRGLCRIIVVANCFGAWSSIAAAPMVSGLEAMVLVNCPVRRDHDEVRAANRPLRWWLGQLKRLRLSKLRSPSRRARYLRLVRTKANTLVGIENRDGRFARAINYLIGANIPLLLVYGPDGFRPDFDDELRRGLGDQLERASPPTRYLTVPERLQGFATLASQVAVVEQVGVWLDRLVGALPPTSKHAS